MVKCLNCHKEVKQHDGKRHKLYCNATCRVAYKRKAKLITEHANSEQTISEQPLANKAEQLGKCKYCGVELDHPKQVCCGSCAWKRPGYGHDGQRPKFQSQGAVLTGGYKLTAYERQHYKPASELGSGEYNPVSKPGDADYDGVAEQHSHEQKGNQCKMR